MRSMQYQTATRKSYQQVCLLKTEIERTAQEQKQRENTGEK
jgi:hypothetical protein